MLLLPGFFPSYNRRTDIIFQIITVLFNCGGNAEYAVIIAVVHLNLLAAALQESLSDV